MIEAMIDEFCKTIDNLSTDLSKAHAEIEELKTRIKLQTTDNMAKICSLNIRDYCGLHELGTCVNNSCADQCFSGRKLYEKNKLK